MAKSKKHITALERVQHQAARFCTSNYQREPGTVTKILEDLQWDTLQTRRKYKRLCKSKMQNGLCKSKMQNGLVEIPLNEYVQQRNVNTRGSSQKYIQISHKAKAFEDSFFVSTINDWNKLRASVLNSPTIESFKSQLSQHR